MRSKTHSEFIEEMKITHPDLKVLGTYVNNKTPIEIMCIKCEHIFTSRPNDLLSGKGCRICANKRSGQIRSKTHEQFLKEVEKLGSGIECLDTYINSRTYMNFRCKNNHIFTSTPHEILDGYGCPYCAGNKILKGFNDLWTLRPDVAEMLLDKSVGYTIGIGSHKKVDFVCPECGSHKNMTAKQVIGYGFGCQVCSDGISYPNKFSRALLNQLPVLNVSYEFQPEWAKPYFYDNYFEYNNRKYILEMDGAIGHGCVEMYSNMPDIDGIKRDNIKDDLANKHGITVIRIDCKYDSLTKISRFEYVKNSIMNSYLSEIFDLNCIDYDLCNKFTLKSLSIQAARMYDDGLKISEISKKLKVHYSTVYNWLKELAKYNLCSYVPIMGSPKKEINKN